MKFLKKRKIPGKNSIQKPAREKEWREMSHDKY